MNDQNFQSSSVIGLGAMGNGIAQNIAKAGHLKSVFDSNKSVVNNFVCDNKIIKNNIQITVNQCDTYIFIVPSNKEIRDFLFKDHFIDKLNKGSVIIDLTTSNPKDSIELAKELQIRDLEYLDCGMTGGAIGADNGTLTLMIGGDTNVLEKVHNILDSFTNNIFHVGKTGSGHSLKLIHNMVTHTIFLSTVEGVKAAERLGVDPKMVIDVFNNGNARSFISESRFPKNILSDKWDARSKVSNLYKDLSMATEILNAMQVSCPFGDLTTNILSKAMKKELQNTDFSKLYLEYYKLIDEEG
tara:strand:+ start:6048 stop:6944 length:897 start_codon:yes stop_codon:yes gene_type:complete